jgi:hypothetical protein
MAARRLLAVAVAALLLTGAVLVRQLIRGDGHRDTTDRAGTILVCATELAELCSSPPRGVSEVIIEPAGVTLERWSAATGSLDGRHLADLRPVSGHARRATSARGRGTARFGHHTHRRHLAGRGTVHGPGHRARRLVPGHHLVALRGPGCGIAVDRGRRSKSAWGTVRPALGNAERDASGLLALAHATAGYFDRVDFTRNDWEADPGFMPWARRLITAVPVGMLSGGTPYATLLTRPSALDIAATTDDELVQRRPPATLSIAYPEPMMDARVVVRAPAEQSDPGGAVDLLAGRASDAGWPPPSEPAGPAPSARTMLALRQLWIDVT